MPTYGAPVDFSQIPAVNFVPPKGTTPPASPVEGQFWYDDVAHELKIYKSGQFVVAGHDSIVAEVNDLLDQQADSINADIDAINSDVSVLQGDVQTALTNAQIAQSVADGAIRTYYAADPPWANGSTQPTSSLGDLWYDSDDGQAYRWNGTVWQVIEDNSIAAAMVAAQNAQTTANAAQTSANGKNTVYYQTAKPTGGTYRVGDTWFDTDDGNRIYRFDGTDFVAAQLGTNAIANLAITNALIADGTIQNAKIGNLDAGKITTGSLDAARITANSITVDKLTIGSIGMNKVINGDFEEGLAGWSTTGSPTNGTCDIVSSTASGGSGSQSLRIVKNATAGTTVGAVVALPFLFPVSSDATSNRTLWLSCRAKADAAYANGFFLRIAWFDAAKASLTTTTPYSNVALTTSWQIFEAQVIPPAGAFYARVTLLNSAANSTTYVDDVICREVVGTAQIADDGITAAKIKADAITAKHTITGPLFQTNASANRGIKIVSAANSSYGSLIAYDAAGNPTFTMNGQTGSVAMKGDLTSGSTIAGATVTGGSVTGATLQTAATGKRVAIAPDSIGADVKFYSGDPSEVAPGGIDSDAAFGYPYLSLQSPLTTSRLNLAEFTLSSSPDTGPAGFGNKGVVEVGSTSILKTPMLYITQERSVRSMSNGSAFGGPQGQTLPTGNWEALEFDQAEIAVIGRPVTQTPGLPYDPYDTRRYWTNKLGAGIFRIEAQVRFDGNATGRRGLRVVKNAVTGTSAGTVLAAQMTNSIGSIVMDYNISTEVYLDYDETIRIEALQNTGGNLDVIGGTNLTYGTVRLVSITG